MIYEYQGKCRCGNVTFTITLPRSLNNYAPRACDCDFCSSVGLAYLSDPAGTLEVHCPAPLKRTTQGSGQAVFLSCSDCGVVVTVAYPFAAGLKGNVNAALINERALLQEHVTVSPKLLRPAEKIKRWDEIWCPISLHESA